MDLSGGCASTFDCVRRTAQDDRLPENGKRNAATALRLHETIGWTSVGRFTILVSNLGTPWRRSQYHRC
jgi:hypothetical protein